jgi:hypothetical protein
MRSFWNWLLSLFHLRKEDGVAEPDTETGQSQLGFSAAMHAALETEKFRDAPLYATFRIVDQWVEITHPRESPWHITYNVKVQQTGP